MEFLEEINRLSVVYLPFVLLGLAVLIIASLAAFIQVNIRFARLNRRYRTLLRGMDGVNLENLLLANADELKCVREDMERLNDQCVRIGNVAGRCVQKVGIVRFNAFDDTGSDLSFAVALLDAKNNGIVISSIFGRSESRAYAKPVAAGQSSYFLTEEEKAALQKAQENFTI